jgi:hypothetical protein
LEELIPPILFLTGMYDLMSIEVLRQRGLDKVFRCREDALLSGEYLTATLLENPPVGYPINIIVPPIQPYLKRAEIDEDVAGHLIRRIECPACSID